jgi:hypothetical protein
MTVSILSDFSTNASNVIQVPSSMSLPKASGTGVLVDNGYGWRDLIGVIHPKTTGVGSPTRTLYAGNIYDYAFITNDQVDCSFHLPHDYAPGTDLYIHPHWSHTGTSISGSVVFQFYVSYAKGHNQANFSAEVAPTVTYATVDIATTPRYRHRIDEIQLSAASPSGTQIDSDDIEVDGLILLTMKPTTIPTIGGGGSLFVHFIDIHYQSTGTGTKQKAPPFWT